jgi:membrane associated rhomboid family serine protease
VKPFKPPARARATNAILIGCVAVQLLLTLLGSAANAEIIFRTGLIPARLSGVVGGVDGAVPAPLTLLTSLFVHGGWLHLGMNALFLLVVGRMVEWVLGPARLLALYLIGGVAAGFLQVIVDPSAVEPVVGASGAISAVFGCYAVMFARRRLADRRIAGIAVSGALLTSLWFAAAWTMLQLATGAIMGREGVGIAVWAHVGGFLAGLVYAHAIMRRPKSNLP